MSQREKPIHDAHLLAHEQPAELPPFRWNSDENMRMLHDKLASLSIHVDEGHCLMDQINHGIKTYQDRIRTTFTADEERTQLDQLKQTILHALWQFLKSQVAMIRGESSKQKLYLAIQQVHEVITGHFNQAIRLRQNGQSATEEEDQSLLSFLPLPWHRIFPLVFDFVLLAKLETDDNAPSPGLATPTYVTMLASSALLQQHQQTASNVTDHGTQSSALLKRKGTQRPAVPTPLLVDERKRSLRREHEKLPSGPGATPTGKLLTPANTKAEPTATIVPTIKKPGRPKRSSTARYVYCSLVMTKSLSGDSPSSLRRADHLPHLDWSVLVEEELDREASAAASERELLDASINIDDADEPSEEEASSLLDESMSSLVRRHLPSQGTKRGRPHGAWLDPDASDVAQKRRGSLQTTSTTTPEVSLSRSAIHTTITDDLEEAEPMMKRMRRTHEGETSFVGEHRPFLPPERRFTVETLLAELEAESREGASQLGALASVRLPTKDNN